MTDPQVPVSLLLRCYQQAVSTLNHTLMQAETLEQFLTEVMTFVTTILNAEQSAVQLCLKEGRKVRFFYPAHNTLLDRLQADQIQPVELIDDTAQLHFSTPDFTGHLVIHPVSRDIFDLALDTLAETICLTEHLLKARNEMLELRQREQLIDQLTLYVKTDTTGTIQTVSSALAELLGQTPETLIGQPLESILTLDPAAVAELPHLLNLWHTACTCPFNPSSPRWFQYWKSDLEDMFGECWHFYLLDDITLLLESEQEAVHDPLTELYNRRLFKELLEREIHIAQREQEYLCLMLLDLDHFKAYNDSLGHPAGDKLLRQFAQLLREHFRRSRDLAFRIGGEEFAVVYTAEDGQKGCEYARTLLNRLNEIKISHPGNPPGKIVTFSAGVICLPPGHEKVSADTLYRRADALLYQAKQQRNSVICSSQLA